MIVKINDEEIYIKHKGICISFNDEILPYLKYRIIGKNKITTYFYDARLKFPNRNIFILGDVFYDEIIEIVNKNIESILNLKENYN